METYRRIDLAIHKPDGVLEAKNTHLTPAMIDLLTESMEAGNWITIFEPGKEEPNGRRTITT